MLQNQALLSCEVAGIIPNNKNALSSASTLEELANQYGVPILSALSELNEKPDFLVSVQFNKILKPDEIAQARELAVNLHMAPLPEYRGCNQFSFAIIDQVKEFGTSIHRLDASIDGGDLLFESRFSIEGDIFVKDLYERTVVESIQLFEQSWPLIIQGEFKQVPQSELENRKSGFHLRKEIEQLKRIDKDWPEEKQARHFRASYFPPYEPPILVDGDEVLRKLDMNWYTELKG